VPRDKGRLAVALRDVEPATFEHCALIRDWLADLGVDRVTLSVIPAADHHPFFQRSPALAAWLRERQAAGDSIAQQGFVGTGGQSRRAPADHVRAGRRLLELAGLRPSGYHAPSWWHVGAWVHRAGTLRVDIRPADFGRPGRVRALERTLRSEAQRRRPVTFDELANSSFSAEAPRVLRPL
jgi:hypothetical protein